MENNEKILSVAPMMDWTDRHCRYLHRQISTRALLYSEMITSAAIVHGDRQRLLGFDADEHPVALQLGGSNPAELAQATKIAEDFGYDEVNLNVGCPSDRVQSGTFGAVLMKTPELVAECLSEMLASASRIEITVKCRIGVDDQDPTVVLPNFIDLVQKAGVKRLSIHARKAWLEGLSPKQNRDIPPLDYELVYKMKRAYPSLHISINGGVASLEETKAHLKAGMDGVMVGRSAYHNPMDVLQFADRDILGLDRVLSAQDVVQNMMPYIEQHLKSGGRLNQITRHMLGLFTGKPGAKNWRRHLSEFAHIPGAGLEVITSALDVIPKEFREAS